MPGAQGGSDDEEDMVVQKTRVTLNCPVSRLPFVEPVKNPQCGHTFSKDALMQLVMGRSEMPCPVAGCNRNVVIRALQPDEQVIRRMEALEKRIFALPSTDSHHNVMEL